MKTLTITDARKNLGQWLKAAAQGEEIAIISGADIIGLKKIEVRPAEPLAAKQIDRSPASHSAIGLWSKRKEDGVAYQRRLRSEWKRP
jgi:antitoxin (DNA-binding transcriptional repressor) of toxin-antitoxin stability system